MMFMAALFLGTLSQPGYIDQQYIAYHFDSAPQVDHTSERKKAVFYAHYQIQKAKFSDSYLDIVENIEDILEEIKALPTEELEEKIPFVSLADVGEKVVGFGCQRQFSSSTLTLLERDRIDFNSLFNGTLRHIDKEELKTLMQPGQKLKKVPIIKIENLYKNKIEVAYAYVLVHEASHPEREPPINLVMEILKRYEGDNDFIRLFAQSTFLGNITLEEWLSAQVKEYYESSKTISPVVQKHIEFIRLI